MELTLAYSIALGSFAILLIVQRITATVLRYTRPRSIQLARKHLLYKLLWTRFAGSSNVTRLHGSFLAIYFAANVTCCVLGVDNVALFASRTGLLSIINIAPLMLGGRTNPILDMIKVDLNTYGTLHRWSGRVALLQGMTHCVLHLINKKVASGLNYKILIVSILVIVSRSSAKIQKASAYTHSPFFHLFLIHSPCVVRSIPEITYDTCPHNAGGTLDSHRLETFAGFNNHPSQYEHLVCFTPPQPFITGPPELRKWAVCPHRMPSLWRKWRVTVTHPHKQGIGCIETEVGLSPWTVRIPYDGEVCLLRPISDTSLHGRLV